MIPGDLVEWGRGIAVFGGVLAGIGAVGVTSVVWFRKQILGWSGSTLCALGTVLIVSSLFHNVTLAAGTKGIELNLAELKTEIEQTKIAVQHTNEQIAAIKSTGRPELASLQRSVQEISAQLAHVSSTSNAALVGLQDIKAKVSALPAVERAEPPSEEAPLRNDQMQKPELTPFAPTKR